VLVFAVLPTLEGVRFDISATLATGTASSTPSARHRRMRHRSLALQMGLAFALLISNAGYSNRLPAAARPRLVSRRIMLTQPSR
jgi:hypothetical protein